MKNRRGGFTLMEMLIVVAIIAILTGVAIPVFSAQLEKTRAGVCMANRRSLQSVLTTAYLSEPDTVPLTDGSAVDVPAYPHGEDYDCPSKGAISAYFDENGVALVACTKHSQGSLGDKTVIGKLNDVFGSLSVNHIDSGAMERNSSWAEEAAAKLKEQGIELANLNAVSWRYDKANNGKTFFYWSMEDVKDMTVGGNKVLTICYNFSSGNYSIWESAVETGTTDKSTDTTPYNKLGSFSGVNDYNDKEKNQTYENALKYYLAHYKDEKYQ